MKNKCVYLHRTNKDGVVFYVGIGKESRPYNKADRSQFWKRYVTKHGEYSVIIAFRDIDERQAKAIERGLICIFKRRIDGGTLVNITVGGDSNPMDTEETRALLSKLMKNRVITEDAKKKMSLAKKGKPQPEYLRIANEGRDLGAHMKNDRYREMTRARFKGKARSDDHRRKNGIAHSKTVSAYHEGVLIKTFNSQRDAAKWAGCTPALIGMAVSGKCKTAKGYKFSRSKLP